MKRVNNIYEKILDTQIIHNMYIKRVKINTKNKIKLERFESNYSANIMQIKNTLENSSYKVGKYNIFLIKEPKLRLIMSQNIKDKLVNHLVSEYFLVETFDNTLINLNVATRKNKGTHFGMKKLITFLNQNINKDLYILKFDIYKFFYNLDHQILKKLIRKKIKDKKVLQILDEIISSTDADYINKEIINLKKMELEKVSNLKINKNEKQKYINDINNLPLCEKGKSLPIGNMSSQALAIIYLNELDHYIKEVLKPMFYERYMDDGLLISTNKNDLKKYLSKIIIILDRYKLELNNKTKIFSLKEGFEFLGFRYIKKNNKLIIRVKNQTKRRFKRNMSNLQKLYLENKIEKKEMEQICNSYINHLNYGNTKKLIENTFANILNKKLYLNVQSIVINEFGEIEKRDMQI